MKKGFLLILSLILLGSLFGCGKEEPETQPVAPPTRETVHYGPAPTEPALTEATAGTQGVEVKDVFRDKAVLVDYATYYYHIPAVSIPGVNTDEVNQQMYYELYSFIDQYVYDNPDYPCLGDMSYLWGVRGDVLSVLTEIIPNPDSSPNPIYVIYHVDLTTGGQISSEEVLSRLGVDQAVWREQVKAALERTFLEFYGENEGDFYLQQYENTISEANINNALPYVAPDGEICFVADVYSLAGADSYRHLIRLEGQGRPEYPKAEPFE